MAIPPSARADGGPPSEGEFVRALRDLALVSVNLLDEGTLTGLTMSELAEQVGLSRPSVAALVRRFDGVLATQDVQGNVVEAGAVRRWGIDPKAGIVVGVEIGPDDAHVAVADLYGRIEAMRHLANVGRPDETLDNVIQATKELMAGRSADDVVGLGVSLDAPIEDGGTPRARARPSSTTGRDPMADWQFIGLQEHLRARLGWSQVAVLLDNHVNLSARAEYVWGAGRPLIWGAERPSLRRDRASYRRNNIVYIEWSRAIGAGLILNGLPYRGEGVAGEIGHTAIGDRRGAEVCERCGKTGCLEVRVGWERVLATLHPTRSTRFSRKDLDEALLEAQRKDLDEALLEAQELTIHAFSSAARKLGSALASVVNLLNPQLLIIGGEVAEAGFEVVRTPLLDSLSEYAMRSALADLTIVPGQLSSRAALHGALALVLQDPDLLVAFLQRRSQRYVGRADAGSPSTGR